jgi:hypothetical protein
VRVGLRNIRAVRSTIQLLLFPFYLALYN